MAAGRKIYYVCALSKVSLCVVVGRIDGLLLLCDSREAEEAEQWGEGRGGRGSWAGGTRAAGRPGVGPETVESVSASHSTSSLLAYTCGFKIGCDPYGKHLSSQNYGQSA